MYLFPEMGGGGVQVMGSEHRYPLILGSEGVGSSGIHRLLDKSYPYMPPPPHLCRKK